MRTGVFDVRIAFAPDLHGVPVDACNHAHCGQWGAPKASAKPLGGQRDFGSGKGGVELPFTVGMVFHVDREVAIRPVESPLVPVVHLQKRRNMKLLGKVERALATQAIVYVRVPLPPGDVRDLGHNRLEYAFSIVRKVERNWVELVSEVAGMRQQVHV